MFAARPTADRTNVAQTHRHFVDSFSGSSPEDATQYITDTGTAGEKEYHPNYWRVVAPGDASVSETGGNLRIDAPGSVPYNAAEIQSINDYGLNFFASPVRVSLTGIDFDLDGSAAPSQHRLTVTISSTRENHWSTPSAAKLWIQESEKVSLSFKTNQAEENAENVSEPVDNSGNGDIASSFSAHPDYATLTLDRTSYHLEVGNSGGDVAKYSGLHGLNPSDWGQGFYLAVEGLYNSGSVEDTQVDSSFVVGNIEHEQLLAFDAFQNGSVRNSGYQFRQYTVVESNTDTSPTASDGLVLTADGTGATRDVHVISRVDSLYNVFASKSVASGDLALSGTAASGKQVFKYFLCSEEKTPTAAEDAIEVHITDAGGWAIYEKLGAAGTDPSSLTPVALGTISAAPTSFAFESDVDNYRLTINGTSRSNGAHDFRNSSNASVTAQEFKFGVSGSVESGDACYGFSVERDENTSATAVSTLTNFQIERDDTDFAFYTPRVFGPLGDGNDLRKPKLPRAQSKIGWWVADVTKAPFNADPTGVLDSTAALNHALNFGKDHQVVVFFPEGTYRVSDTVFASQMRRIRSNDAEEAVQRNGSIRVQGSYAGTRPKIVLTANSAGFDQTTSAGQKPVLEVYSMSNSASGEYNGNDGMENVISNIDIKVEAGNPGAIGVRAQGAQGCELRDMCVDLSESGYACVSGGPGSGGGITNIHCMGGVIGLDYADALRPVYATNSRNAGGAQPVPTVRGCIMEGQTNYAAKYLAGGPLVMVGCEIRIPSTNTTYTGIFNQWGTGGFNAQKGQIACVDTVFEFEEYNANNKCFAVGSSITLKNVHANRAATVVSYRSGSVDNDGTGSPSPLGGTNGWIKVSEYAQGVRSPAFTGNWGTNQYEYTLYVDGSRQFAPVSSTTTSSAEPPATLRSARLFDFPHWEMAGLTNVKDYGATGNGYTDDSAAIAAAITAADATAEKILFFPGGDYVVRQTFDIPGDMKVFGVHLSYSRLVVREAVTGVFDSDSSPSPIFRTANSATAAPMICDLTLWAPSHYDGAYCLRQRAGQAVVWGVGFEDRSDYGYGSPPGKPSFDRRAVNLCWYSDNGGGILGFPNQGGHWEQSGDSRHFLFDGLTNDLDINHLNVEHMKSDAQCEFNNCTGHTEIFGLKSEGPYCSVWFSNGSENFELHGFGGNVTGVTPSIWNGTDWPNEDVGISGGTNDAPGDINYSLSPTPIRVDSDCNHYRITNVGQSGEKGAAPTYSNVFVRGYDPATWNFINLGGTLTNLLDWPVLAKKGTPPA